MKTRLAFAGAVLGTIVPSIAAAQEGYALNMFHPTPAGDRFFGAESAYVAGDPGFHFGVVGDYASNPLAYSKKLGTDRSTTVVSDQLHLHLNATAALWDRLQLNLVLPVAVWQAGDSPTVDGVTYASPDTAQIGDLRLGLRANIYGEVEGPFQIGVAGHVWIPTAPDDAYVGSGDVRFMPKLVLSGDAEPVIWSLAMGPDIRPSQQFADVELGTMLRWDGGVAVVLGDDRNAQIGPEVSVAFTPREPDRNSTHVEALLAGRYRPIPELELGIGAGPGITPGFGTPDARIVSSITYTPATARAPSDKDADGVPDKLDKCPEQAAPPGSKDGCPPPPDGDGDGVPDSVDACADVAGEATEDPKTTGCPADGDGDGTPDVDDMCPAEPAGLTPDPEKPGCPAPPPPVDTDGDGVADADDACPTVAGPDNGCPADQDKDGVPDDRDMCPTEAATNGEDPARPGCPGLVKLESESIEITEQVRFETGTATILAASSGLLDQVAAALKGHPEIKKLEVEGHTDNTGNKNLNQQLSQRRADAVRSALIERGVEDGRLVAKGYGQDNPIADNATDEGRAQNRRVAFRIVEKETQQ